MFAVVMSILLVLPSSPPAPPPGSWIDLGCRVSPLTLTFKTIQATLEEAGQNDSQKVWPLEQACRPQRRHNANVLAG